jgi:hypothetical protein
MIRKKTLLGSAALSLASVAMVSIAWNAAQTAAVDGQVDRQPSSSAVVAAQSPINAQSAEPAALPSTAPKSHSSAGHSQTFFH